MVVLPLVIALSLVLGFTSGGRLQGLRQLHLRGETLLLVMLAVQVALPLVRLDGLYARLAYAVWFATFPVMILVCFLNRGTDGMTVVAVGLAFNAAVIGLNGGMPVLPAASAVAAPGLAFALPRGDFVHVAVTATTRLRPLADVLPVPGPVGLRSVASPGDVLLVCGVAAALVGSMLRRERGSRGVGNLLQSVRR